MRLIASASLVLALVAQVHAAPPADSVSEVHGDWRLSCVKADSGERCSIAQVQADPQSGARTLAIELRRADNGGLEGVLALPFGLALPRGVLLTLDDVAPGSDVHGFSTCLPDGCIVPLRFDATAARNLSTAAQLKIQAIGASDGTRVQFQVSLKGFGKAADRLR